MDNTTTKATHTSGPWEPRVEDGQLFVSATETRLAPLWSGDGPGATCDTTKNVAIVCKYQIGEAREANAHLIAAAPEMYEALKRIVNETHSFQPTSLAIIRKFAGAAITKAEGRNV